MENIHTASASTNLIIMLSAVLAHRSPNNDARNIICKDEATYELLQKLR